MSRMTEIFEKLFQKMKFTRPVPMDVQGRIFSFKVDTLISVLKKFGQYNFFYGSVMKVYFTAIKMGLKLSINQSKAVIVAGAILILAGVTVSVYLYAFSEKIIRPELSNEKHIEESVSRAPEEKIAVKKTIRSRAPVKKMSEKKYMKVNVRLNIERFIANRVEQSEADEIMKRFYDNLKKIKGVDKVTARAIEEKKLSANKALTGRVSRLGSTRIVAIKVIDVSDGAVILNKTLKYKKSDDIDLLLKDFAIEISNDRNIWSSKK